MLHIVYILYTEKTYIQVRRYVPYIPFIHTYTVGDDASALTLAAVVPAIRFLFRAKEMGRQSVRLSGLSYLRTCSAVNQINPVAKVAIPYTIYNLHTELNL